MIIFAKAIRCSVLRPLWVKRFPQRQKPQATEEKAKTFAKLVLEGKVNAAIQLLDDDTSSGVLPLSANVIKALLQKHPDAKPSNDTMMLHGSFNNINEIIFDKINADVGLELKVHMDLQDWMLISGVRSYVVQPLATYQTISVML